MRTRGIDDQIRELYMAQRPTPEVMARLVHAIAQGHPAQRWKAWARVAAAALVVALVPFLWWAAHQVWSVPPDVGGLVAREAAAGHNGRPQLEFRAGDYSQLRAAMKSLDFQLVEPSMQRQMRMRLLGARYTSLGGSLAAQLAFVDVHGSPCTLYEARPVGALATLAPGDHQVDGLRVTVWMEKGLVMVLAQPLA
ncbi:MAG TPA: hypothetical protein VGV61_00735 [Thermoanaerobaculia bacterium]|jgi:hypothetical protein|nr:hypothetical protein [Thermoanaerobaculia bacterium]